MSDTTERLRVIIELDGTAALSDGTKLSAEKVRELGEHLAKTGLEADKAGEKAVTAGKNMGRLGRELAQGDWRGSAVEMGKLAMGTELASESFTLLAGGVGLAAAGLAAYAVVAYKAHQETERQANALLLTGNYAGLVAGQLNDMARSAAASVNASVGDTRTVMEGLVATGRVTRQSLSEIAQSVQLVTQFSGQSRESVLKDFAGMADGVAKWAAEHNRAYHFLTFEQYKYIESLELAGNQQEAMRKTSELLNQHLGGDLTRNLGTLQKAWVEVGNWASWAWDKMLNAGRAESASDKVAKIQAQLDALANRKTTGRVTQDQRDVLVANLQDQLAFAQEDARLERRAADAKTQAAQQAQDAIQADRSKPKNSPIARVDPEIESRRRLVAELAGLTGSFAKDWERLNYLFDQGTLSLDQLTKAQADLLAKQPLMRAELQAQAAHQKDLNDTRKKAIELAEKQLEVQARELSALAASNVTLEHQIEQVGLTTAQLSRLKVARLEAAIADERLNLVGAQNIEGNEAQAALLARKIALLERERDLTATLGKVQLNDEVRKQNEADSKKFSEDIHRDLRDSLKRGFEAGKDPASNLADAVGNMIKTRVTDALFGAMAEPFLKPLENALKGLGNAGVPGLGGLLGGVANSFSSVGFGTGFGFGSLDLGTFLHGGGVAGNEATFTRSVNPAVFAGAPRFHTGGITGDEVPVITQKGEGVFTPGQMAALAPVGAGAQPVTVNVFPTAGQTATVTQKQDAGGGLTIDVMLRQVEEAIADNVAAGSGAVSRAMESRYGLRTAVA